MMGILTALIRGPKEEKSLSTVDLARLLGGGSSKSGAEVNVTTALRVSAVLACTRVIAEGIAQIPLRVVRQAPGGGRSEYTDHPLHRVLAQRPNSWQTSFELREMLGYHAVLTVGGNCYVNRVRGEVREIVPLQAGSVTPVLDGAGVPVAYRVGLLNGQVDELDPSEIWRIHGPSWNSYQGVDIVQLAREAVGLSISLEEAQARLHGNGARPGGILTTDQVLKKETKEWLRSQIDERFVGNSQQFKTMVLDAGYKWQALGMTAVDAATLDSRRFQIEEVCRMFRVSPHMIGHSDKTSTYAASESFFRAHVTHTLGPWIERWEASMSRDLLTEKERADGIRVEFSVQGLMRGDSTQRAAYYASGITNGWLTRNEARAMEGLEPIDGLDMPMAPLNMAPVGDEEDVGEPPEPPHPGEPLPNSPADELEDEAEDAASGDLGGVAAMDGGDPASPDAAMVED